MFLDLFEFEALETHLAGRDVLAVLATGIEKSLNYQKFFFWQSVHSIPNASGLVSSPLKSVIGEQVNELTKLVLSVVHSKN